MTFHLMFVHIILSSVELLATFGERAAHSVDHMFSLYFDYVILVIPNPVLVLRAGFGF